MSARPTPEPVIEAPSTAPSVVERLSAGQLAAQTGTTPDHVRRLEELGIIHAGADGTYTTHDVERIHVADGVHGRGISLEDLARAVQAGFVDFAWIRSIATSSLTDRTYAELYADLGRTGFTVELRPLTELGHLPNGSPRLCLVVARKPGDV